MAKKISLIILVIFVLSACGFNRNSNDPANPETQINGQDQDLPNTGNEGVNEENDLGVPNTGGILNDPSFEKPK